MAGTSINRKIFERISLLIIFLSFYKTNLYCQFTDFKEDLSRVKIVKTYGEHVIIKHSLIPQNKVYKYFKVFIKNDTLFIMKNPDVKKGPYFCEFYLNKPKEVYIDEGGHLTITDKGFKDLKIIATNSFYRIENLSTLFLKSIGCSEGTINNTKKIGFEAKDTGKINIISANSTIYGNLNEDCQLNITGPYTNKGIIKKKKT